ncbi:MAG: hypothetical protein IPJ85_18495, partial [Flavobacteriales bacterium]|nr:hypothetical protein [Flavobacteriales bacterium]
AFATEQWDENDVIKRDASRVLADTYKALGQTGEALKWTEVTHQWEDSIRYRQQANKPCAFNSKRGSLSVPSVTAWRARRPRRYWNIQRAEARSMDRGHRMRRINLFVLIGFVILFAGVLFVRSRTNRRVRLEQLRSRWAATCTTISAARSVASTSSTPWRRRRRSR